MIRSCGSCPSAIWRPLTQDRFCRYHQRVVEEYEDTCAFVAVIQRIVSDALDELDLDLRLVRRGEE